MATPIPAPADAGTAPTWHGIPHPVLRPVTVQMAELLAAWIEDAAPGRGATAPLDDGRLACHNTIQTRRTTPTPTPTGGTK